MASVWGARGWDGSNTHSLAGPPHLYCPGPPVGARRRVQDPAIEAAGRVRDVGRAGVVQGLMGQRWALRSVAALEPWAVQGRWWEPQLRAVQTAQLQSWVSLQWVGQGRVQWLQGVDRRSRPLVLQGRQGRHQLLTGGQGGQALLPRRPLRRYQHHRRCQWVPWVGGAPQEAPGSQLRGLVRRPSEREAAPQQLGGLFKMKNNNTIESP
jgi:hypothetical protein